MTSDIIKMQRIHEEWAIDCIINPTDLNQTSHNIPRLHSKYGMWLSISKMCKSQLTSKLSELMLFKRQYYSGELDKSTLDRHNLDQFQRKVLKTDMQKYLDGDVDVIRLVYEIDTEDHKIKSLEYIMRQIMIMNMHVRNIIDRDKFLNGEL